MFERSSRPNRHLGEAPQQTSDEQVLDIIASAGLATSSIPVVQEREQALRAGDDALSLELRRTGESGFREAMRAASLVMLGLFFVGIGLGVVIHSLGFPWWLAPLLPGVLFAGSVEFVLLTMMAAGASLVSVAVMTAYSKRVTHSVDSCGNAYERYPQFHTRVLLGVEFSGAS